MRAFKTIQALTILFGLLIGTCTSNTCLTDGGASSFDIAFRAIAEGAVELVPKFLSPNFKFYSDSLELLIGGALNSTGAHNPAEFIAKYVTPLPEPVPSKSLYLAHTCDTITSYWQIMVGKVPVRGFNLVFVDVDKRKITKAYTEINNGAARYAICQVNATACPQELKVVVGNEAPEYGFAGC